MLKIQRMKTLTSLFLAAAMTVLTVSPAMGEEVVTDTAGIASEYEEPELDSEPVDQGNKKSASGNNYNGVIFVRDDGLYDLPAGGNKIDPPGVTFNPETYTLTLSDANIGCVYDDVLRHDMTGAICFCGSVRESKTAFGNPQKKYPDYKVILNGHNYLGGYSTFERRNNFPFSLLSTDNINEVYLGYPYAMTVMDDNPYEEKPKGGANSVTFEGDGDITINGRVSVSMDTAKTVWISPDYDGAGIISLNRAAMKTEYGYYGEFCSGLQDYIDHGIYYGNDLTPSAAWHASYYHRMPVTHYPEWNDYLHHIHDSLHNTNISYVKIGETKPDVPEKEMPYVETVRELGDIGGHTVSVCFIDNIPYDGRKKIAYGYTTRSAVQEFDLRVYVDGKAFYPYDFRGYRKEQDAVKVKFKNNRDVTTIKGSKAEKPSFAFSLMKESGLDASFIKAVNEYFRNKENWITFTILPQDIRYAETTFLGSTGHLALHRMVYISKMNKKIKKIMNKNLKMNGNTIKKASLLGVRLKYGKGYYFDAPDYEFSKKLRWDKNYNEANPNPKKDFHAEVSGNYIVITGQGNYTGTVTVRNPYNYIEKYGNDENDLFYRLHDYWTIYDYEVDD